MRQFSLSMVGHNGGSNYYGPRSKFSVNDDTDKWLMAVQFAELKDIDYLVPLELEAYKEYDGTLIYDWWGIKCDASKTLRGYAPKYQSTSSYRSGYGGGSSYNGDTSGSGKGKTDYFVPPLRALGYDASQILLMSWKTARTLKEGKISAKGTVIKSDGTWLSEKDKSSSSKDGGQMKLITDKENVSTEVKVLAYPPLCEGCQKNPGDTVYDINDNLKCENCGDLVEAYLVPRNNLLSGWTAVSERALSQLDDDSDDDLEDWEYQWLLGGDDTDEIDFSGDSGNIHLP